MFATNRFRSLLSGPGQLRGASLLGLALIASLTGACGDKHDAPTGARVQEQGHDDDDHGDAHEEGEDHDEDEGHIEGHDEDHDEPHDSDEPDEHEGHMEGEPLKLSPLQASAAGIELFRVGPGMVEKRLVLPAVVEPDTNAISHVTSRISGVVREVHMGLGQRVEKGDLMCVIDSVELGGIVADYRRDRALAEAAQAALEGETEFFANRIEGAVVSFDGTIEVRQQTLEQEQDLYEKQVSTIRPVLDAERALREARLAKGLGLTELHAERDARLLALSATVKQREIGEQSSLGRLSALGIRGKELEAMLGDGAGFAGSYSIRAQRTGVIIKRLLSVGQFVPVGTELFEIQDLSKVWVVASAFEGSLRHLKGGQRGEVRLHAFPDTVLTGEIVKIHYSVDRESRALALRIELENKIIPAWDEEFPLRPGMFGEVSLIIDSREAALALPEAAIIHLDSIDAVFVQVADGHFEKRIVEVIGGDAEFVEVRPVPGTGEALQEGDLVVVGGTFTLKSMDQSENLVGHDH